MVEERVTLGVALEVEESSLIFLEPVRMSLARLHFRPVLGVLVAALTSSFAVGNSAGKFHATNHSRLSFQYSSEFWTFTTHDVLFLT
jgi:hypothetical protein